MFGLSSIAIEAIAAGVVALLIFGGGMKVEHDIEAGKMTELVASYQKAQAEAVADSAARQKVIDDTSLAAATQETQAQAARATLLQKELANATTHLSVAKVSATCVPYGFYRFLYAGSRGVSTDSITLATGQSDDQCSGVGWTQLASEIVHNYGQANANAGQLNSLIAALKKDQAALKPVEKK